MTGDSGWSVVPDLPRSVLDATGDVLAASTADAVVLCETTGDEVRAVAVNDRTLDLLERRRDDVVGSDLARLFAAPDADRFRERCGHVLRSGQVLRYTDRIPLPRGVRTFDVRLAPVGGGDRSVLLWTGTDVTERDRAELATKRAELRVEEQLRSLAVPTFTWRRSGDSFVLAAANAAAQEVAGAEVVALHGERADHVWADSPELVADLHHSSDTQQVVVRERWYRMRATGRSLRVLASFIPIGRDLVVIQAQPVPAASASTGSHPDGLWLAAFDTAPIGMVMIDEKANFVAVNAAFAAMIGRPAAELVGTPALDVIHPDERDAAYGAASGLVEGNGPFYEAVRRLVRADGAEFLVSVTARILAVGDEGRQWLFSVMRDVTDEHARARRLAESEERHRNLVESLRDAMLVEVDGVVAFANEQAAVLLGATDARDLVGLERRQLLPGAPDDGAAVAEARRLDGRGVGIEVTASPTELLGREGTLLVLRDVTGRVAHEAALVQRAQTDRLTGLANRDAMIAELARELDVAAARQARVAVLFVDLDRLKAINDAYGHEAGDVAIVAAADRLRRVVGARGAVYRFGGEAFVVTLPDHNVPAAVEVAERALREQRAPIELPRASVVIPASIGVAVADPTEQIGAGALVGRADSAMYRAKLQGGDRTSVYDPLDKLRSERRFRVEERLRDALAADAVVPWFQPIVVTGTGEVVGFEALARWTDAELGEVSPGEFVAVAEQSRLIEQLGRSVLRTAASAVLEWDELLPARVAVNVSARELANPRFVPDVREALANVGLPPHRLVLEITESVLMAERDRGVAALMALRGDGVGLSIDDFGTGYSSLAYLRQLPFTSVKIDRAFVAGLPSEPADLALVRAIIDVARDLGLAVVAEGVETEQQRTTLHTLGCDLVQGFHISRPLPAADVGPWLRQTARP